jgi:hypothetical protein
MRGRSANLVADFLALCARQGRFLLILGLVVGIASPRLAIAFKPTIEPLIAGLLFLSALRIGPRQLIGVTSDIGHSLAAALLFQLALPIVLILIFAAFGWSGLLPTALVLMAAAAPISGSPNLSIMMGHDPAPALRLLALGTAILPATVLPIFWLAPNLGGGTEVLASAGRLLLVIAASVGCAFAMRAVFLPNPTQRAIQSIDGISALVMGAVVIGLMSAVGTALFNTPALLGLNLLVAFAANFLLQIGTAVFMKRFGAQQNAVPFAIAAGNRNIALFLTALPAVVTDPLLLFIGCYQIPMYLTPLLLHGFYRRKPAEREKTVRT